MWPILEVQPWHDSHDGVRYPFYLSCFRETFSAGAWYPRWCPEMLGGYGYPVFLVYQPAFFYLALPFTYLDIPFTSAVRATVFLSIFIGALGSYLLARRFCASRALCAALAFLFTQIPYFRHNLYTRGDFSELLAQCLCPLALWALLRLLDAAYLRKNILPEVLLTVLTTTLVMTAHPFVAVAFLPICALLVLWHYYNRQDQETLVAALGALVLTIIITTPYWLGILQTMPYVYYEHSVTGYLDARTWLQKPDKYLSLEPTDMVSLHPRALQLWMLVFPLLGFWWTRKALLSRFLGCALVVLVLMTTIVSLPIWNIAKPVLKFIEFPFRLNATSSCLQLVGLALLAQHVLLHGAGRIQIRTALLVCLALLLPVLTLQNNLVGVLAPMGRLIPALYKPSRIPVVDYNGLVHRANELPPYALSFGIGFQLHQHPETINLPNRFVSLRPRVLRSSTEDAFDVKELPDSNNYRLHIKLDVPNDEESTIHIQQFYYPGWTATANGKPVRMVPTEENPTNGTVLPNGLIAVTVRGKGEWDIVAWYDGPPGWRLRNLLMVVALAACSAMIATRQRWLSFLRNL